MERFFLGGGVQPAGLYRPPPPPPPRPQLNARCPLCSFPCFASFQVISLHISPHNGEVLLAGMEDGAVVWLHLGTGKGLKAERHHEGSVECIASCPNLPLFASCATDGMRGGGQPRGSANAETTPAGAPAAAADRTQRPDATCEGKNG